MFVRICSFPPFTQISYQLCRTGPGPSAESPGLFQMCSKDTDRRFQGPSHRPAPLSSDSPCIFLPFPSFRGQGFIFGITHPRDSAAGRKV